MKHLRAILSLALLSSFTVPAVSGAAAAAPRPADLAGQWLGTLDAGAVKLRVAFNLTASPDGTLSATMDSIDQGANGIPVDKVTVDGTSVRFEINAVRGGYEGTFDPATGEISGQWTQGPQSLPLNLAKAPPGGVPSAADALSPADRAANKAAADKVAGVWNGTLVTGGPELRLRVNIVATETGAATGTMDSLDQNANGIPLSAIALKGDKLHFEVPRVVGAYDGTLAADGATLKGEWRQGGQTMQLNLTKAPAKAE